VAGLGRIVGQTVSAVSAPHDERAAISAADEADHYRRLERAWQDDIGCALLDKPYQNPGAEAVFLRQWDRLIAHLDERAQVLVEVGCGKGHFLEHLAAAAARPRLLIGVDLSRAVFALPARGLSGVQADGERLPFRDGCASCVLFDGSLHHMIDYPQALREAIRLLQPGGLLLIYEPLSSRFSQLVHRLLDPIIFRHVVYESPIDIKYKHAFQTDRIIAVLREQRMAFAVSRSDVLAYPFTGCYASSFFARRERFMRFLIAAEDRAMAIPLVNRIASVFAWRFTIAARKDAATCAPTPMR
jgi:SAM-dependent methyltransferase